MCLCTSELPFSRFRVTPSHLACRVSDKLGIALLLSSSLRRYLQNRYHILREEMASISSKEKDDFLVLSHVADVVLLDYFVVLVF